ncbi:unnamed protein product [Caenorhabditis angaria]|uniref:Saposin B-type domain-containing protein n=1 Tax=Caenorhabditis angaria TaxID=860376 RepID=A0A9P1IRN6_9PELO|nr:unnamed protein product [Caenorhabditis angaria]
MKSILCFFLVLLVSGSFGAILLQNAPGKHANLQILCNLCQEGFGLVQKNLKTLEALTNDDLVGLINNICQLAPDLDIVHTVCDVVRDDLVDSLNKFLQFLERSAQPSAVCKQLFVCQ